MTETKDVSTAAIFSLVTGHLLCNFSEMHEAAEYIMGHAIFTHQFVDSGLYNEIKRRIHVQHPTILTMPQENITKNNCLEYLAKVESIYGKTMTITKE